MREKKRQIRAAEQEIRREACELHDLAVHAAELEIWKRVYPATEDGAFEARKVVDELMGVLVLECPEDVYMPGTETLKWAAYGCN